MATRELKATVFYNAGELTYNFPFDYIKKRFVSIKYIDNFEADTLDAAENLEYGVDYTINDKVVTLKEAGDTSKYIYIYRSTPTEPLVDFSDSSFLTEENLDLSSLQQLHLNEEMSDYLILHKVPSGTLTEIRDAVESANQSSKNAQQSAEDALEAAQNANANAQSINIRTFQNVESMKQANNLKAGALVKTQGFYQSGDGGGADYVIVGDIGEDEVDEASIIALQKGLYAKLLVQDYVNVKQFGAKGNGTADDTEALQKAINFCKNNNNVSVLLLKEGNYKTTDTLNIYLDKFAIKGKGNTNIIPHLDSSIALVFTMNKNVNYLDRYKHNRKSGGFSILGDNTTNTTLMAVGDGEKSVNCCEFENIFLTNATTLLHCKAHTYKNNFYNIVLNVASGGEQPAFIYDSEDTSEVTNFIGCSFWAGRLQIGAECNFYGCTLHFTSSKIKAMNKVNFTDCHFEILNRNNNTIDNAVLSSNYTTFNNCNFVCSDVAANFTNNFFIAESDDGNPASIILNKCNLKYFLGRLTSLDNSSLCKGDVYINNTAMKYKFDSINLKYQIYDYTDTSFYLDKNQYIYSKITTNDVTIEKNDSSTKITIAGYHENFSVAKRYLIPYNARSINFIKNFTSENDVSFLFGGNEIPNTFQGIVFYDYFMNKLPIKNSEQVYFSGKEINNMHWLPIPPNAVYVDIGFYMNGGQNGNVININKYGVEFL